MLKFGDSFITFESCNTEFDVFFDDLNQRICIVRENGEMGITAKSLNDESDIFFRISNQGRIKSLNFSFNSQIASIHRDRSAIDLVFLNDKKMPQVVRQSCRNLEASILGVQWISDRQLCFVMDQGLELYSINSKKRSMKFTKSVNINVNWFASYTPSQLILIFNGISNSILNPFLIQSNVINRLSRFEVDFGCSLFRPKLLDCDITIASIYERVCILVLKGGQKETFMEKVNIYEFSGNDPFATPQLTKTLLLNINGFIGVHVIDNAIFVHHKNSCTSLVFEIGLPTNSSSLQSNSNFEKSKIVQEFLPLCITNVEMAKKLKELFLNCEISLYSPTTAIFAPDFIVDIRFGVFTKLTLSINQIVSHIKENDTLLDFLMQRSNAEDVFLEVFKKCLLTQSIKISKICKIFRLILEPNYSSFSNLSKDSSIKCRIIGKPISNLKIDHNIEYIFYLRNVFDPLRDSKEMDKNYLSYLVLEFFLIVKKMKISLEQNYLPEFLIRVLVDAKQFNKLQQLLQYGVIDDSKFLVIIL